MKLAIFVSAALLSISTFACSKHECKLDSDGKKQAFGALADMTHGAFSCDIDGSSSAGGMMMSDMKCEIGAKDCVPSMNAIHPSPATVKDVAAGYRSFLEKNQWKLEEKPVSGKFMNGKPFEGVQFACKNADKTMTVRIVPFGESMVETRTYLADFK